MIEALILDYGEVLARAQSRESVERMAHLAGLDPAEFRSRYWRHRQPYDAGRVSGSDYWRLVIDHAAPTSPEADAVIAALKDADYHSWIDYRDEVWEIAADFKRRGRTAILSNGVPEVMERVAVDRPLDRYFDRVIVSYEVGFTKPAPEIYDIALAAVGVPAANVLFVDDRPENLEAAERAGIQTLPFIGDSSVETLAARLDQP
jgi:putative hydrolase of the HAD superfamily